MTRSTALLTVLLLAIAGLSGCTSRSQENVGTGGDITPVTTTPATPLGPLAHFVVDAVTIRPPDGTDRQLREDDDGAIVRYAIRQPDDAPTETAYVSFALKGRVVDVATLKLAPGESKTYERRLDLPAPGSEIRVEVRAGGSVGEARALVAAWPRAGEPLAMGPLTVRVDYGLMEKDGRVLVNVTLDHRGPQAPIERFRVKMVCADASGNLTATTSVEQSLPTWGNVTGADVLVDDCPASSIRYALEFKADGEGDLVYYGRIVLAARPQA